jgi:flagellar motor switch/type III secretory pathway protein FliN
MNAQIKTTTYTCWQPRRLEGGEFSARERIVNQFPGMATGVRLSQLASLTGIDDLRLYLDGLTALRLPDDHLLADVSLLMRSSLPGEEKIEEVVIIAISKASGLTAERAVLMLPLPLARQIIDLALGRTGPDNGPLSFGEQGVFLYALDRAGGDWGAASGGSFVVRGMLAHPDQVADYLQAQPTWQITARLAGERMRGYAALLFADTGVSKELEPTPWGISPIVMGWQAAVNILVGWSSVSFHALDKLETGDIVVLDEGGHPDWGGGNAPVIVYSGDWNRLGTWLDHRRIRLVSMEEQEVKMKTKTQSTNGVSTVPGRTEDGGTESIEVVVRVEVGEVKMTVAKASELVPGRIIVLDRDVDPNVLLKVGDQVIGHGELVEHDGVLAVEVTEVL